MRDVLLDGFNWKLVLRGYFGHWIWIRGQNSKFRNGWSNMATKNFEKSNELVDLDEKWYQGVIWVAEYEFEMGNEDLIWRPETDSQWNPPIH